jgi:hypothetical protein
MADDNDHEHATNPAPDLQELVKAHLANLNQGDLARLLLDSNKRAFDGISSGIRAAAIREARRTSAPNDELQNLRAQLDEMQRVAQERESAWNEEQARIHGDYKAKLAAATQSFQALQSQWHNTERDRAIRQAMADAGVRGDDDEAAPGIFTALFHRIVNEQAPKVVPGRDGKLDVLVGGKPVKDFFAEWREQNPKLIKNTVGGGTGAGGLPGAPAAPSDLKQVADAYLQAFHTGADKTWPKEKQAAGYAAAKQVYGPQP